MSFPIRRRRRGSSASLPSSSPPIAPACARACTPAAATPPSRRRYARCSIATCFPATLQRLHPRAVSVEHADGVGQRRREADGPPVELAALGIALAIFAEAAAVVAGSD